MLKLESYKHVSQNNNNGDLGKLLFIDFNSNPPSINTCQTSTH